jgi:hypothetical protein
VYDLMEQGDVKPRTFAGVRSAVILPSIRRATLEDMPRMIEMAKTLWAKYPERNVQQGEGWMKWCIQNPERLVLLGSSSIGVASVSWNYGYERRARIEVLAGTPAPGTALQTLRMVRLMLTWAKEQGAEGTFRLDADTDVDFGPFAKRLGGKPVTRTRYEIPL